MNNGPYQSDGETVYATEPDTSSTGEERDWPDHTDPEWLHYQYHTLGKTLVQMSNIAGVSDSTVLYQMKKHGVERRDKGEAISIGMLDPKLLNEDWLREKYVEEEMSTVEIGEICDVPSGTVHRILERNGIETRSFEEAAKIRGEKVLESGKHNDRDWLHHQYITLGKSGKEIAEEADCHPQTVWEALERHNITTRSVKARFLNKHKMEKCETEKTERELVSSGGIDASWEDIQDKNNGCYIQYRDPNWLRDMVDEGLTMDEMVERCNVDVGKTTIYRWLNRFGIDYDDYDV